MRLPVGTSRPEKGFFVADRSYSGRGGGVATRYHRDCVGYDEFVAWRENSDYIHTHSGTNSNTNAYSNFNTNAYSDTNACSNFNSGPAGDPNSIA
jgi:hypothetical protein